MSIKLQATMTRNFVFFLFFYYLDVSINKETKWRDVVDIHKVGWHAGKLGWLHESAVQSSVNIHGRLYLASNLIEKKTKREKNESIDQYLSWLVPTRPQKSKLFYFLLIYPLPGAWVLHGFCDTCIIKLKTRPYQCQCGKYSTWKIRWQYLSDSTALKEVDI